MVEEQTPQVASGMEVAISNLLRGGLILSGSLLLVGVVAALVTGQTGYGISLGTHLRALSHPGATGIPTSLSGIAVDAAHGKPFAIIGLGVVVLIATPIARVAATVILFLHQQDRLYALVTTFVLAVLVVSLLALH